MVTGERGAGAAPTAGAHAAQRAGEGPRVITILGATGSIGRSTMDLVTRAPEAYRVEALTAHRSAERLAAEARRVGARLAVVADPDCYGALKDALAGSGVEAAAGPEAVVEAARRPADWVMAAIVGAAGLAPTLAAAEQGRIVAFANKECLVCAGTLMLDLVRRHGATLLPVDSEHNAIFQVFDFARPHAIRRIILTASGGPFRTFDRTAMAGVSAAQAVAHPVWAMGAKISVDSATMMNKGLEVIEAHFLFDMPSERIDVLIHPQSVVHSLVEYRDGSVLAQLGSPDMRTPIAFTLAWPDRIEAPIEPLDLARVAQLSFEAPDPERFPALRLARAALQSGGTAPTILNAANEVAVEAFLNDRIGFLDIERVVDGCLGNMAHDPPRDLDDIWSVDAETRHTARALIAEL